MFVLGFNLLFDEVFSNLIANVLYRFNVYVTQPEVKPGCILRRSNVNVLEKRGLVQNTEVSGTPPAVPSVQCL